MSDDVYAAKQRLAKPGRYYGDGGTIHSTGYLDVETRDGHVVAVWFRCQMLPFRQTEVDAERAAQMGRVALDVGQDVTLTGVEVLDEAPLDDEPPPYDDDLAEWELEVDELAAAPKPRNPWAAALAWLRK